MLAATSTWTWPDIIGALVPTLAALGAALISYLNRRQLRTSGSATIGELANSTSASIQTSNGKSIGQMVEETHDAGNGSPSPTVTGGT